MKPKTYLTFLESLDGYNHYADDDGNEWYVPIEEKACTVCRGLGEVWSGSDDDNGEYIECPVCFGKCHFEHEYRDLKLSAADYESLMRQEKWLHKRYGQSIPRKIVDYWMRP